jgi:hypothetical protein
MGMILRKLLRDNRETFDPRPRMDSAAILMVILSDGILSQAEYFIYQHDPVGYNVFSLKDSLPSSGMMPRSGECSATRQVS